MAYGIFFGHLPYAWIGAGGIFALIVMSYDYMASKHNLFRIPVLAVALGMYLPILVVAAVPLGAIVGWGVKQAHHYYNEHVGYGLNSIILKYQYICVLKNLYIYIYIL